MDKSFGADGPAILKLHKWAPFNVPLNLSEFREAFISPSKQLLLLLSYQCEALLLPIREGVSEDMNDFESCHTENTQNADHLATCSQATAPSNADSWSDSPCTSGSGLDRGIDYAGEHGSGGTHPFIYGVNSVSWGVCDDTYNQHKDASYREFLFVSGAHGLKVHAFCRSNGGSDKNNAVLDDDNSQGRWTEWGPDDATAVVNVVGGSTGGGAGNGADDNCRDHDACSSKSAQKRWLRSFLADAETVTFDGNLWTKFPEPSSFPFSAEVVSFSLFDGGLPFLDCPPDIDVSCKAVRIDPTAASLKSNSTLYKCSKVFANSSHHLVGFHLMLIDSGSENGSDECHKGQSKHLVVVSRLEILGIQWVSLVKLDNSMTMDPAIEWGDFCFSENLIACLASCGFIFLYSVTSGERVSQIDIIQTSGLYSHLKLYKRERVSGDADSDQSGYAQCNLSNKRLFRKLIVAPYTSLLAAVDNHGIVYVLSAADSVPTAYYSYEKLFPHFQCSGLGRLVPWVVGGSEIGQQKVYSDFDPKNSSLRKCKFSFLDKNEFNDFWKIQHQDLREIGELYDRYNNGASVASKIGQRISGSESSPHFMRRVFLPTDHYTEHDCICFSPFGLTRLFRKHKEQNKSQILHSSLHAYAGSYDDNCLNCWHRTHSQGVKEAYVEEAIGCTFQGSFYLVTQGGLSVVLPSVSVSSNFLSVESIEQPCTYGHIRSLFGDSLEIKHMKAPFLPWKIEILDRIILFDGAEAADNICSINGWDLKISRIRRLQMAVDCLKFDEIEKSLESLLDVSLAEEGILRLIFAIVYLIVCKTGNDSEASAALRLLSLATNFAIRTIRNYGLVQYKKYEYISEDGIGSKLLRLPPPASFDAVHNGDNNSKKLCEMAHFLEIIRRLQVQLSSKIIKPGQGLEDEEKAITFADTNSVHGESQISAYPVTIGSSEQEEISGSLSSVSFNKPENLAMVPMDSSGSREPTDVDDMSDKSAVVLPGVLGRKLLPLENPKEMIARWKLDNLDLKSVVKDALLSGRLPLAVLQLHLHRSRNMVTDKDSQDTFTEVRDVGIAIAYDLFLKGETGLAVATLQRLGEDIEISLKQLLFGTLKRSMRLQLAEELKIHGYLGPFDWKMLEKLSLIERLYPSSTFWKTFVGRQEEVMRVDLSSGSPEEYNLCLLHWHPSRKMVIKCGEVDGVVLGPWANLNETSVSECDDDNAHVGYWAAAAVWTKAWDQRTIDRIILDQPYLMGVHVPWEVQLEYYICHNDLEEVSKLLNLIPMSVLSQGSLQISLDCLQTVSSGEFSGEYPANGKYLCSLEELDSVCMDVPEIKIFRFSASNMCSMWLREYMEQELVKKFIFLKEIWQGTAEIVSLVARSGFITTRNQIPCKDDSVGHMQFSDDGATYEEITMQALHKLIVHHCVLYNLPNLLDLYLDCYNLALDEDSLNSLLEAAGDCEWARWLLLSRMKGHEYDASFSNARFIMSKNPLPGSKTSSRNFDEIICTVDDIAEGGSELAALATLMHSPVPIQNCLTSGSVNKHGKSSVQCTLESLRPALQRFPTLWRSLVAGCFGQDITNNFVGPRAINGFGGSALSEYLSWRDNIFHSSGRDTSLLQMLPCWFPKALRRLLQLFVQGPIGWHSLSGLPLGETFTDGDIDFYLNGDEHSEVTAVSWEATIQKRVEEELYDSSLVESELGLEHHLHRGRALAAFNQLLGARIQRLKSERFVGDSEQGQTNVQSDVQTLLAPITLSEQSLLSSVIPLAVMHFEDSMLVASSVFLLELCGLSASMLRVDIAALRRISRFYKSIKDDENKQLPPKGSALLATSQGGSIADSLARAVADEYMHQDNASISQEKETQSLFAGRCPSRAFLLVLQHLEKASLPHMANGKTCGYWLLRGDSDGNELRSQQKAASQYWNLVTLFCQMHKLPLSTKYLALLARDNDWVGFLSEAQVGGYTYETVLKVASEEFSDPRLKVHVTTVLKGMQSRKKSSSSSYPEDVVTSEALFSDESVHIPVELFRILAECEKEKYPGKALLVKAKELSWSLLAVIASCFTDVTPLSCLTVWLEITAARETSSIKVNDIASQIANSVAKAVEATNSLPAESRTLTFHYNRRSPKRRRLMEPTLAEPLSMNSDANASGGPSTFISQIADEERKEQVGDLVNVSCDSNEGPVYLSKMVAVLCEQHLFLPLLRAFEMFLPSCSLLPFIRALQAFSQMRVSEASAHLGSFSARIKEEPSHLQTSVGEEGQIGGSWISSTAVKGADAMLSTCPSPYERRCLLELLADTDFGDGGSAAAYYRRLYWKINLAEPLLRKDNDLHLGNETLDDASLLTALEKNGHWEQARNWARQLEASGGPWKSVVHRVTETQAESMVAEWKEFLWDVPEERVALWGHCQTLFIRYSFPPLQAGSFFLKHAEAVEKDLPAKELHELLLLALQWLSGMITLSNPVYPLHILREIETRTWLLAVEAEAQVKSEGEFTSTNSTNCSSVIDRTASIITKIDNHINSMRDRVVDKHDAREYIKNQGSDNNFAKARRRAKVSVLSRRSMVDTIDKKADDEDGVNPLTVKTDLQLQDENYKVGFSFSKWEERVGPAEMERAVLSLLEFGQVTAAKQLQQKLSPEHVPPEFLLVDVALKLAAVSAPKSEVHISLLDHEVKSVIKSHTSFGDREKIDPLEALESLVTVFTEGSGRGLCKRIIAIVKAANTLGLSFVEAFDKQPVEVLQLLSLKAQESFEEAKLLVQTYSMSAASIAQILAESFLKGLLAAHRGGYMDLQKEEGPSPLLWRFSDFLKWAELCPSEPEIGHALMRLVITGQEIPHACEVELLILSHHFYKSSACLDGVDVLVALAATRVEAYVSEGDFACLARLLTGVGNFQALNFILGILIENGQLDILLQKYSAAAEEDAKTAEAVRGFRMSVLTSLKHFNPNDLDAIAMVYNHFDMKHEAAALLESRAEQCSRQWFRCNDKDQNEDLLDSMRYFIEAAEVHSSLDAGNKTRRACAQASLVSLQIRMPDIQWLHLSETNARRALVEQSRFQEALIVAEAYGLNQPSEWALVLWNQMLHPELTEEFVAEFVAVLPLQPSMLVELAKFYRAEVVARGDQSQFSVWLTGGGMPAEWAKNIGRSFRCLLKRTRDIRLRLELARVATGFNDVVDACMKTLDKVPENAGPLVLRKGHGGAYLPLM